MDFLGHNFYMGRLMGVRLFINISLPIFLIVSMFSGGNPIAAFLFYTLIFGFVLMHEFAHSFAANAFGAHTDKIVLYMFGGQASMGSIYGNMKNLVVILAGPASNLALAGVLSVLDPHISGGFWLHQCVVINIVMGLFNLIPAYPMDGGQALVKILNMFGVMTRTITKIIFLSTTISCLAILWYFGMGNINAVIIVIMVWVTMLAQYRTGRFP